MLLNVAALDLEPVRGIHVNGGRLSKSVSRYSSGTWTRRLHRISTAYEGLAVTRAYYVVLNLRIVPR